MFDFDRKLHLVLNCQDFDKSFLGYTFRARHLNFSFLPLDYCVNGYINVHNLRFSIVFQQNVATVAAFFIHADLYLNEVRAIVLFLILI